MKYQEILPISRLKAEEAFLTNNVEKICNAMLSIAYYDEDWKWVQDKCLSFFFSTNDSICVVAATCLGHLARIHRKLERGKVIEILSTRLNDPKIGGRIEDALEDIRMFTKKGD